VARVPTFPHAVIVAPRQRRLASAGGVLPPTPPALHRVVPVFDIPPGKPADAVAAWRPTMNYLMRIALAERIDIDRIALHDHPAGTMACFMAQAAWDSERVIELCGRDGHTDKLTALHELAHLQAEDWHGIPWVIAAYRLHRKYLPANRVRHADWLLGQESGKARTHWRRAYGSRWYGKRQA